MVDLSHQLHRAARIAILRGFICIDPIPLVGVKPYFSAVLWNRKLDPRRPPDGAAELAPTWDWLSRFQQSEMMR